MSDARNWTDERPELLVEQLVGAARAERPSADSLARALSSAGVAAAATGAATTASAAASGAAVAVKTTSFASGAFLKWTLLAAAVAGGTSVAVETLQPRSAAPAAAARPAPSARETRSPTAVVHVAPSAPAATASAAPLVPKPARTPPAVRADPAAESPPAVDAERLAEEVRSIDAARVRVSSGRAGEALAVLDEYERAFEKPGFAPEALYLRMEALLALGQHAAARSVAARLARSYPQSPQAPRARQVLAEQNP